MSKVPDIKVTLCLASFNRLEETKTWIRRHCKYVDRTIIIDGGSEDGSIEYFNSDECKDLSVECYVHEWVDDPPGQRNKYLDMITDGWVLVLDCDELLEVPALYQLKFLAKQAEDSGCDGIAFRAHDIQIDPEGGIYDSLSNYYNRDFFKACPGMKYVGHTHVALQRPGMRDACMKTEYQYFHIKPWQDVFWRGCRNYWTTAGVAQNTNSDSSWQEFKKMTKEDGFEYFHMFAKYLKQGNVDSKYKKWFIDHKDDNNSEARSWFTCYLVFLHPGENIDKVFNQDLPYIENREPVILTA